MPIIWRYLLSQYLKVLFFSTVAFIAILLTTRLDDIAHFATLGAEGWHILLFTLHQIPYILPIAIPISGLISALILVQRLSQTHELTAFRSCGMALQNILAPILIAAAFLALGNFYIVSEMATQSHLAAGLLKSELRAINPLLLLHNKHLMRLKGFYFESMGPSRLGEYASEVIIATPNKHNNRLNLMIAQELQSNSNAFIGSGVTLISSLKSDDETRFDPLIMENMAETKTSIADFSQMIQKKVWTIHNDHLKLPMLLVRKDLEQQKLANGISAKLPANDLKQIQKCINGCNSEIARRISIALATFTFTLMGACFGISISRNRAQWSTIVVIGLACFFLASYFVAKAIEQQFIASTLLYLVPHLVIIVLSVWILRRVAKGVE